MSDLYNITAERLWEKLEFHRNNIDTTCVNFNEPFPMDQLRRKNPQVAGLIKEVEKEHNYEMSEFQCSWAVSQFIKGGLHMMQNYNNCNATHLSPRA